MSFTLKDLKRSNRTYTFEAKVFILDLFKNKGYSKKKIINKYKIQPYTLKR